MELTGTARMIRATSNTIRVLLVGCDEDGQSAIQMLLRQGLPLYSVSVRAVNDSSVFLRMMELGGFDVAVVDDGLNWSDGLTVLRAIQRHWPDHPVIMLVDPGREVNGEHALQAGLYDYAVKPVEHLARLATMVERAGLSARQAADTMELRSRFTSLFNGLPAGFFRTSPSFQVVEANPALFAMFGFTEGDEVEGLDIRAFFPPGPDFMAAAKLLVTQGVVHGQEIPARRRDGTPIFIRHTTRVMYEENGNILGYEGFIEDVTDQHHAARQLRSRVVQQEAVAALGALALMGTSFPDLIQVSLDKMREVLGIDFASLLELFPSRDELVVQAISGAHEEYVGTLKVSTTNTMAGYALRQSSVLVYDQETDPRFERSPAFIEMGVHSSIAVMVEGHEAPYGVLSVLSKAKRTFSPDDVGFVQAVANLIAGAIERGRSEREITEIHEQLLQSQRLEAVGRLAGGIAHDFNNLLTAILGYAALALDEDTPEALQADLGEILRSGHRAEALVGQLLAFSRRQVLQPVVLDPGEAAQSTVEMLRRLISEDIELVFDSDPELGHVKADRVQLEQVLLNLMINARDAMPDGGTLEISVRNIEHLEEEVAGPEDLPHGPYVSLAVRDTGIGMDQATMASCFEPFFTTKPLGIGTGLGLATAHGIVKQSGGTISVQSELGSGSVLTVYLPRTSAPPVAISRCEQLQPQSERRQVLTPTGTETLLVVEDEPAVRVLVARLLEPHGYTVLQAANGVEALDVVSAHPGEIHLMITDLVMPQMGGVELAAILRSSYPTMKVLYTSGYSEESLPDLLNSPEDGPRLLEKPFDQPALSHAVRELLDDEVLSTVQTD